MIFSFGEFELDTDEYELRRLDELVKVEPQVFDVLVYLVSNAGRVLLKTELLDEVWGDRFVSESALTSRIKSIRQLLGDDARSPSYIETVHRRGYRFIHDVTERAVGADMVDTDIVGSLPRMRTRLVGRSGLVDDILGALDHHRFVSLIGLGGAGKTMLSVSVGHAAVDLFPDGVWFVDLVPCRDRASIQTTFAHTVGLVSPDDIAAAVDQRKSLFILDNCEHVVEAAAVFVDDMLANTTNPRVLTTSREPLGLVDEFRFHIGQLDVDAGVELLRTCAARVDVEVGDEGTELAEQICRHLDGLPLAIELAAAQLRHLSLQELADRLPRRLDILAASGLRATGRHSSLVGVLDDTWSMLSDRESELLPLLAAFPGTFSTTDVEQLTEDPSSTLVLGELVDRSLVTMTAERQLRLLETVRLHAVERFDNTEAMRQHADWCLRSVGDDVEVHLADFETAQWCAEHFDDLRTAVDTFLHHGDLDSAARLAAAPALAMHIDSGARAAASLRTIDELLSLVTDPELTVRLHLTGVMCAMAMRRPDLIAEHGRRADAAADDFPALESPARILLSWSVVLDSIDNALDLVEKAERSAIENGQQEFARIAASYRAMHLAVGRRFDEAAVIARSVYESRERHRLRYGAYSALAGLAAHQLLAGDPEARTWATVLETTPSRELAPWGNHLTAAGLHAAQADAEQVRRLVHAVKRRLNQAGVSPLPDLLLPIAVLAHRLGEDGLAGRWVRTVKTAGRPTQSFQMTILYRRLREALGDDLDLHPDAHTLEEIGVEALNWLATVAGQPPSSCAGASGSA